MSHAWTVWQADGESLLSNVCLACRTHTPNAATVSEQGSQTCQQSSKILAHFSDAGRSAAFGEAVTPVVVLFLADPPVYVFILHGIPVIQISPEGGVGKGF